MDFMPIERPNNSFQQSLTADEITRIYTRVFGSAPELSSVKELGLGMYNNTYLLGSAGSENMVVLRVAPPFEIQFRSEKHLMRNEYAAFPYLSHVARLMPRIVAADWSHNIIDRDWMIVSFLKGTPAPEKFHDYPRDQWHIFYHQLGEITREIHSTLGPYFGPIVGYHHASWTDALFFLLRTLSGIWRKLNSTPAVSAAF